MKSFIANPKRATQLLLSVFVVLACSLHFGIRVSEGDGQALFPSDSDISGGAATTTTYANVPDNTVLLTFTIVNYGCPQTFVRGVLESANRKKDNVVVTSVPFTLERKGSELKYELKTDGTPVATGVYTFKVWGGVGPGTCLETRNVSITVAATPTVTFDSHDNPTSVAEDAAIGTTVIDLNATPANVSGTPTVTYTLEGSDANSFEIDSDGVVKTKVGLDYETKTSYSLTIRASIPAYGTTFSGTTTLTVNVTNVNEAPVFAGDIATRAVQENSATGTNIGSPVTATDPDGDTLTYTLGGTDSASFAIDSATGQLKTTASSPAAGTYSVTVTASDSGPLSDTITVTINVTSAPPPPEEVQEEEIVVEQSIQNPPPSPATPAPASTPEPAATPEAKPTPKKVVGYQCPVGWQRTNGVGRPTPKVFVQAIEVEIDKSNRAGIYTLTAVEIYVDPTEGLTDLAGWKLKLAVPYNHGREYLLTAENAVVSEDGVVRIESPEADPFPIRDLTYAGQVLPGFDYRLFTEKGRRVDFAISCYKDTNATLEGLVAMETPRIIRSVDVTHLDWAALNFLRSKWGVPVEAVPVAPSLSNSQGQLTTMWSVLKKQ